MLASARGACQSAESVPRAVDVDVDVEVPQGRSRRTAPLSFPGEGEESFPVCFLRVQRSRWESVGGSRLVGTWTVLGVVASLLFVIHCSMYDTYPEQ